MEKRLTNYLMAMFGLVITVMTTLPSFGIELNLFRGTVLTILSIAGIALVIASIVKNLNEWKNEKPLAFIITAGISAFTAIFALFIGLFGWISFITGIVAIIFANKAYNVYFKRPATVGAIALAMATTAALYEVLDNAILVNIAAIVAYVFIIKYQVVFGKVFNSSKAMSNIKIAAIIGIVASVFKMIPLISIVAWIPYIAFAVFILLSYMKLSNDMPVAKMLFIAAILLVVEEAFDFIPVVDAILCPFLAGAAIALNIFGWNNIIKKLEA